MLHWKLSVSLPQDAGPYVPFINIAPDFPVAYLNKMDGKDKAEFEGEVIPLID